MEYLALLSDTRSFFAKMVHSRPGWGRCVIEITHPHTCHTKNKPEVCSIPKTLYGVLSQLLLIHSFSTLLLTLFTVALVKCYVRLYSNFYLLFFFHKATFGFSCYFCFGSCYLLNTLKYKSNHTAY